MTAKVLIIDIETAPVEAYVWGLWKQNVGLDFIKADWTILSFSAKWLGQKNVLYADTGGRGVGKVRDDKILLNALWKLLDEADIVVAQNGKRFDVRKINARLVENGFGPPSPYRVVDTMLVAEKYFAFTSQKLAWTSKLLASETKKDEHKEFPGFHLWLECLADNPRAWKVMRRYNSKDIKATEEIYLVMRPWVENHPNMGVYDPSEKPLCPKCGSAHLKAWDKRVSVKQQGLYRRYRCLDCKGWARGKIMQLPLEKRRSLLVPE
jgi:hypothetical protein